MSSYNYSFNNPVMFNDPSGEKGEKVTNDAMIYDVAEAAGKGLKATHGGTLSETTQSQRPLIDGEFEISTVTETTSDGKKYFAGYYVYDRWLRGDAGGRLDNDKYADPILQYTQPMAKEDFKVIAHAARTFYLYGRPPQGRINAIAGLQYGDKKLLWKGVKQENKDAWTNPEFVIHVVAGMAAAHIENPSIAKVKAQSPNTNIEVMNARGESLAEFDRISTTNKFLAEEKSAENMYKKNPKTGRVQQTPDEWAKKQIYDKTLPKLESLESGHSTRPTKSTQGEVPHLNNISSYRDYRFLVNSTDAAVIKAVQNQMINLSKLYPQWNFTAYFGKH